MRIECLMTERDEQNPNKRNLFITSRVQPPSWKVGILQNRGKLTPTDSMKLEIQTAACFLTHLLRLSNTLDPNQLQKFCVKLEDMLRHHYQHHWFPREPSRGSGYRCLRINHKMDPIIAKAGTECGFEEADLRHLFPNELTLWVDPKEVSYRIGENGSICVLYDASKFQFEVEDQELNENLLSTPLDVSRPSCKESIRHNWDSYLVDSAYVSS